MLRHKLLLFLVAGWFVMVPALVAYSGPIATSILLVATFAIVFRQSTPSAFKELQGWVQEAWGALRSSSMTTVSHSPEK
ncbi:MAG: hypothetical protein NPIRA02_02350 [Nitrospirales bacterium]|nr:MAG: hypothetical protein NPIRA02_02350 [Nitrospirales bacterium]